MVGAHPVGKSTHTLGDSKLSLVAREVKRAALWGDESMRHTVRGYGVEPFHKTDVPVMWLPKPRIEAARKTVKENRKA